MKIQIFRNLWVLQIAFLLLAPLGAAGTEEGDFYSQRSGKGWQGFGEGRIQYAQTPDGFCQPNNKKIWNILFDAVKKQYEQGNEKLYLKQAYDTAQLFQCNPTALRYSPRT